MGAASEVARAPTGVCEQPARVGRVTPKGRRSPAVRPIGLSGLDLSLLLGSTDESPDACGGDQIVCGRCGYTRPGTSSPATSVELPDGRETLVTARSASGERRITCRPGFGSSSASSLCWLSLAPLAGDPSPGRRLVRRGDLRWPVAPVAHSPTGSLRRRQRGILGDLVAPYEQHRRGAHPSSWRSPDLLRPAHERDGNGVSYHKPDSEHLVSKVVKRLVTGGNGLLRAYPGTHLARRKSAICRDVRSLHGPSSCVERRTRPDGRPRRGRAPGERRPCARYLAE